MLFFMLTVRLILRHFTTLAQKGKSYFKDFGNVADFIIMVLASFSLTLFILERQMVGRLMDRLDEARGNEFTKFASVVTYLRAYIIVSAFLICIVVLRLWKYVRFGITFKLMEMTLLRSLPSILSLFVYHANIMLAYTITGWLMFGNYMEEYRNFLTTLTSMGLLSIRLEKHLDWMTLSHLHWGLAKYFYVTFCFIMLCLSALYVTVISNSYKELREEYHNKQIGYTVYEYVNDERRYYQEVLKIKVRDQTRLRGGNDDGGDDDDIFEEKVKKIHLRHDASR